jgi:hypothetical protein
MPANKPLSMHRVSSPTPAWSYLVHFFSILVTVAFSWPVLLVILAIALYITTPFLIAAAAALLAVYVTGTYYTRIAPYSKQDANKVEVKRVVNNFHIRKRFLWPDRYLKSGALSEQGLCFHPKSAEINGSIQLPSLGLQHEFKYRLDENGRRCTALTPVIDDERPHISIYGASVTFGLGVDDDQTFPWHVQRVFPEYRIVNYGVAGFSLYEMWLMMRHTLLSDKKKVAYAVVVLHPNTMGRDTGQYPVHHWIRGPRCVSLRFPWMKERRLIPLGRGRSRLAAIARNTRLLPLEVLLSCWLSLPIWPTNWHSIVRETSFHILLNMKQLCADNNVPLLVLHLGVADEFGEFLDRNQFNWDCAGISATSPNSQGLYPLNLYPFDPTLHPNGEANRIYAKTLSDMLDDMISKKRVERRSRRMRTEKEEFDKFIYPLF